MKKYLKVMLSITALVALSVGLVDCGGNPLLADKHLAKLQEIMPDEYFVHPGVFRCARYLSDTDKYADRKRVCEVWAKRFYDQLRHKGGIPYSTSFKDFRDPQLWKILTAK